MKHYLVNCKNLGYDGLKTAHIGDVLSEEDLENCDTDRLLNIGAITITATANADSISPAKAEDDNETRTEASVQQSDIEKIIADSSTTRNELDIIATDMGIADVDKLPNKQTVVDAIKVKMAEN